MTTTPMTASDRGAAAYSDWLRGTESLPNTLDRHFRAAESTARAQALEEAAAVMRAWGHDYTACAIEAAIPPPEGANAMSRRCDNTNNPCGTDTRPIGLPCECPECAIHREIAAARAEGFKQGQREMRERAAEQATNVWDREHERHLHQSANVCAELITRINSLPIRRLKEQQ